MNIYLEKIKELSIQNKYLRWYCNIINNALSRPRSRKCCKKLFDYVESHHILPKCFKLGGEKDKENLVFLTAREHYICHLLMTKMFDKSNTYYIKMVNALNIFLKTNNVRTLTSSQYQFIKQLVYKTKSNYILSKDLNNNTVIVTKEEFYSSNNYVGITKGKTKVKDKNGNIFLCDVDVFKNSDDLVGINKNKLVAFDITKNKRCFIDSEEFYSSNNYILWNKQLSAKLPNFSKE